MKNANTEHGQACKPLRARSERHICRVTKFIKDAAINFTLRLVTVLFRSRRSIIDLIRGTLALISLHKVFYNARAHYHIRVKVLGCMTKKPIKKPPVQAVFCHLLINTPNRQYSPGVMANLQCANPVWRVHRETARTACCVLLNPAQALHSCV